MAHSRHYSLAGLGGIGIASIAASSFCTNYDPANPATLGISGLLAAFAVIDYVKARIKHE